MLCRYRDVRISIYLPVLLYIVRLVLYVITHYRSAAAAAAFEGRK